VDSPTDPAGAGARRRGSRKARRTIRRRVVLALTPDAPWVPSRAGVAAVPGESGWRPVPRISWWGGCLVQPRFCWGRAADRRAGPEKELSRTEAGPTSPHSYPTAYRTMARTTDLKYYRNIGIMAHIVRYAVGYECGDVGPASVLLNSFSGPARRSAALPQQKRGWTRHPPHQLIRGTGLHPLSPGTAATPARLGTHGASGVSANTTRRRIVLRAFREPRRRAPAPAGSVGLSTPPARHSCRRWRAHLAGAQFPGVVVLLDRATALKFDG